MTEAAIEKRSAQLTIPSMEQIAEASMQAAEQGGEGGGLVGALQFIHAIAQSPEITVLDSGFDGKVITIKVKSPTIEARRVTIFDGGKLVGSGRISAVKGEDDTYQLSINGSNAEAHKERALTVRLSGTAKMPVEAAPTTEATTDEQESAVNAQPLTLEQKRSQLLVDLRATTSEQISHDMLFLKVGETRVIGLRSLGLEDGWLGYIHFFQDAKIRVHAIDDTLISITALEPSEEVFTFQVVQKTGENDGKPVYKYTGVEVEVLTQPQFEADPQVVNYERERAKLYDAMTARTDEQLRLESPIILEMGTPLIVDIKKLGFTDHELGELNLPENSVFQLEKISDTQVLLTPNAVGMGFFTLEAHQEVVVRDDVLVQEKTGVEVRIFVEAARPPLPPEPPVTPKDWGIPSDGQDGTNVSDANAIPELRIHQLLKD